MLRVLIIEDEPPAARRLERLLLQLEPAAQVLDTLDTVRSAAAWLAAREADLIFLDIHLADGNSFSIFEQVQVRTPVIFTTAYDQYALRAFRLNSVDYLLKPVEKEELARSLAKFRELRSAAPALDVAALLEAMKPQQTPAYQKRFLVQAGEKLRSVPIEEVSYFYGQQKFVFLITRDNRR
ncbi:MAG: response regulator, partial [Bacteroidia bacterium]|nr:response regulator [Bacteroidia bacterium]